MTIIEARLIIEDVMNPSDDSARQFVTEMICEVFGKEERKDNPRCKLILLEVKHKV